MTKHTYTTAVCVVITVLMLIGTLLFMNGEILGITVGHTEPPYALALFSTDRVHTLDIVLDDDDWQAMLDNASAEEYIVCNVAIDGEKVKNVAIRPKGNSSLSSIARSDSERYSFKIEFDHYNSSQTYKGLDKLALNNIAQDNTYLKDYMSYQMMRAAGADAPLCSFIYITVNGEDWGLYLAVEGVEEAFAQRNYGSDYGQIYKPDSMDMNAGGAGNRGEGLPQMPENGEMSDFGGQIPPGNGESPFPDGEIPQRNDQPSDVESENTRRPQNGRMRVRADGDETNFQDRGGFAGMQGGMGGFGGRNSSDVALIYTDDEHDSYQNIFDNAVFNPTDADKDRLVASLKKLNEGTDIGDVINTDEVLRYFTAHNFLLNFDSYTGNLLHNYYLYEKDGMLSMIAWDYNLAFGAFGMGGMSNSGGNNTDTATSMVNFPIDTPVSGASMEDRPLLNQLLNNEEYLEIYHTLFAEFIDGYFDSGEFEKMFDEVVDLISLYVEKDPTAFCTYEEFLTAQETLKEFSLLRAESVKGQLDGSIASTNEEQTATNNSGFIDASHIDMNNMGSNMSSFGRRGNQANLQTDQNNVIGNESENTENGENTISNDIPGLEGQCHQAINLHKKIS